MNKLHLDNRLDELKKLVERFKGNINFYKTMPNQELKLMNHNFMIGK